MLFSPNLNRLFLFPVTFLPWNNVVQLSRPCFPPCDVFPLHFSGADAHVRSPSVSHVPCSLGQILCLSWEGLCILFSFTQFPTRPAHFKHILPRLVNWEFYILFSVLDCGLIKLHLLSSLFLFVVYLHIFGYVVNFIWLFVWKFK